MRSDRQTSLPAPPRASRLMASLRGAMLVGGVAAVGFFGVGGYWSAAAPLSSAVVASGVVIPMGSRRVVQHLEGGIIDELKVRDGDLVEKGQVVAVLRGIAAESEVDALRARVRALAAEDARLRAERGAASDVLFSHPSLARRDDPLVAAVVKAELHRLEARRRSLDEERDILRQQLAQLEQQIAGHRLEVTNVRKRVALVSEEASAVKTLLEKGLERKPRLLTLQRGMVELKGEEGRLDAEIAKAEVRIGEIKLRILNVETQHQERIENRLAEVQTQLSEAEAALRDVSDRLSRTVIVAPAAGRIIDLRFSSAGAVVKPGEPLMEVVPSEDELVVEARLSPRDIDEVVPGQRVSVMFPSFPTRHMLRTEGSLESVSADALSDQRTGEAYYAARIKVGREAVARVLQGRKLIPGLPVEVYIETGEQTLLAYLTKPLYSSLLRSLRES